MKKLLLILILCCSMGHAAETTYTIKASGGDFSSVQAFTGYDITVGANDTVIGEISGKWGSYDVVASHYDIDAAYGIDGNNDGTSSIIVRAVGDSRHDGTWGKDSVHVWHHQSFVDLEQGSYRFEGMSWFNTYTGSIIGPSTGVWGTDSTIFEDCVILARNGWGPGIGQATTQMRASVFVRNCMFLDSTSDGAGSLASTVGTVTATDSDDSIFAVFANCTFAGNGGMWTIQGNQAMYRFYNCVFTGGDTLRSTTPYGAVQDAGHLCSLVYCATDDDDPTWSASIDTSNWLGSQTFSFVSATNPATTGDFHLASDDAVAIDGGTDLSAIDHLHTTANDDIDGDARGATWDLGADEYISGAVSTILRWLNSVSGAGKLNDIDGGTKRNQP